MIVFVALGAVRLYELWLDHVHVRRLREAGATYHGAAGLWVIVLGQVLLFAGILIEGYWLPPHPAIGSLTYASLGVAALALGLRHWCILTLGDRWTMAIYTLEAPLVARGPYRVLRHPNYMAVVIELAAIGAALQAWTTVAAAGAITMAGLVHRIRRENRVLAPLREKTLPRQTS